MTPLQLLEKQLQVWVDAFENAKKNYAKRSITKERYELHERNLTLLIRSYTDAINIIKDEYHRRATSLKP
jgi:hypothetical protein